MSGSPKMTNRLPLPVFFNSSAMWREERRGLHDEVGPILRVLAAPDELRVEVAVAPLGLSALIDEPDGSHSRVAAVRSLDDDVHTVALDLDHEAQQILVAAAVIDQHDEVGQVAARLRSPRRA